MARELAGTYFEHCPCGMVCPCTTSGLTMPADVDRCRVVLAFNVQRGQVEASPSPGARSWSSQTRQGG
jgi:hypothetical protein